MDNTHIIDFIRLWFARLVCVAWCKYRAMGRCYMKIFKHIMFVVIGLAALWLIGYFIYTAVQL